MQSLEVCLSLGTSRECALISFWTIVGENHLLNDYIISEDQGDGCSLMIKPQEKRFYESTVHDFTSR